MCGRCMVVTCRDLQCSDDRCRVMSDDRVGADGEARLAGRRPFLQGQLPRSGKDVC